MEGGGILEDRGGGGDAAGGGFMCRTDGTSQEDDAAHQLAHLSAHSCLRGSQ